jgi:ribosomal protein L35
VKRKKIMATESTEEHGRTRKNNQCWRRLRSTHAAKNDDGSTREESLNNPGSFSLTGDAKQVTVIIDLTRLTDTFIPTGSSGEGVIQKAVLFILN